MKVVAINGSPRSNGNTAKSLLLVGEELEKQGIEFEIVHIKKNNIRGCIACGKCGEMKNETCIFGDDIVNEVVQKMKTADGIIISSPVYFAGMNGTMKCLLDRVFYVSGVNGGLLRGKVGASVVALRRSGGTMTFNSLNHYLLYGEMMIATSNYWNIAHGRAEGDVEFDAEGTQIMRVLGKNMAYQLKARDFVVKDMYERTPKVYTHFVREDLKSR